MKIKILCIALLSLCLLGCSSEKTKIKKALRESIPAESLSDYKYKSHLITATVLKTNLEDSISALKASNRLIESRIERSEQNIATYRANQRDCERSKISTLYWLRSDYDRLIRDWQNMIDKESQKMHSDSLELMSNKERISYYKRYMDETKSPIIFYKIRHNYTLRGAMRQDEVIVDYNFKLAQ